MSFQVTCSHCRKQLKVPDKLKGTAVNCPNCKAPLQTPPPADDPYLSDLLSAVSASSHAPAIPAAAGPAWAGKPKGSRGAPRPGNRAAPPAS